MTLKQLRFLREIARQSLSISAAAAALHTSQPSVSRQLQLLEKELGVDLLVRYRSRIVALTEPARTILESAERLLAEADNIKHIAEDSRKVGGKLTVATNPLHAHYTLPTPIKTFRERYQDVELNIVEADSKDIPDIVESGEADLGISTDMDIRSPRLVFLSYRIIGLSVIVPHGHPLARKPRITLRDLASHPIVAYDPRSRSGQNVMGMFRVHGLAPRYVVSARSSDVIKRYVAEGLGIGIVSTLALKAADKEWVRAIDVSHLFPPRQNVLILRRDIYLRRYVFDFIQGVASQWKPEAIRTAIGEGMPER